MEIETLIGSYAFPIVMCLWFMIRTEKVMAANTESNNSLEISVTKLSEKIEQTK